MAGPFDYRINVADPFSAATQGLQIGASIEQLRQQREDRARKLEQDKRLQEQQSAMQERVMSFIDRPTAQGAMALSALMSPDQAKSIREGWDLLDKDTQRGRLEVVGQALTALKLGKSDIAIDLFRQYGEAARNSGDEETARAYDTYAELTGSSPEGVMANLSGMIAPLPGGNEMLENVFKEAKLPGEVREGEAKATTAEAEAKYAEPKILQDMEKTGWDIKKIKQDVEFRPLELNLRRLEALTARENAGLKRQALQLKVDDARRQYEQAVSDRLAEAQSAQINIVDMRQSVSDLRSHPGFSSLFGASIVPGARFVPGTDTAGAEAQLESLKARAFVLGSQKMRGLGALGEKEGAKIEAALASLKPGMPERDALKALDAIETSMKRLDELNQQKYGAPPASSFSGGAEPMIDTAEEYNALPSGSVYIDRLDGKKYRKP